MYISPSSAVLSFTCAGILHIGDPHVCSTRIGRRKDDYLSSVLGKLEVAAEICTQNNFVPLILGDLFHKNNDSSLVMLNRLIAVLKKFPHAPLVLDGNHDKEQKYLGNTDALYLLAQTNVVRVLNTDTIVEFNIKDKRVLLHAVPHGTAIPDAVPDADAIQIMVTHHDLAFGGAYPGAGPLKPIKNIAMVVNGHMHGTKPSVKCEGTLWHNPGNIEPLSIDLMQHVPRVWSWDGSAVDYSLTAWELPHVADIFDMVGLQVAATDEVLAVQAIAPESVFAQMLSSDARLDAAKTDDASVFVEDLDFVLAAASASPAVVLLLRSLAAKLSV
ncbi:MAG: metallophosphoesterase [Agitococcus sp.]|nr:metallophosphoesterase [Agitococcus sp.]MDO9177012.1 metallophosphoesterase [Agitococcus sp.]